MKLYRSLKLSRKNLTVHKLRTCLALIGIALGVGTVIIIVAIGNGAQQRILSKIEAMGPNLLVVNAGKVTRIAGRRLLGRNFKNLKLKDCESVARECPSVRSAAPSQSRSLSIKYDHLATRATVLGTTYEYQDIKNFPTVAGRYFTDEENRAGQRLAVIGQRVVENLFENQDPIDEMVRIGKVPFKVIGVLQEKGLSPDGLDQDNQVLIPIQTALRRVFNVDYLGRIYVQVRSKELMDAAAVEISEVLREAHRLDRRGKPDDFTIENQISLIEAEKQTSETFTLLISGVAAISLLVGGIGILAVMLLSVTERTSEIGLRMATGARPRDIQLQFLFEALILGLLGGLGGVVIGNLGAFFVRISTDWHAVTSMQSTLLSISISLSIGLIFGVYPAKKASMLLPIEALRTK